MSDTAPAFLRADQLLAVVPADDLFGFFRRSVRLPPDIACIVTDSAGQHRWADGHVSGHDVRELRFVHAQPVAIALSFAGRLPTGEDVHTAADVSCTVDRRQGSIELLLQRFGRGSIQLSAVAAALQATLDDALGDTLATTDAQSFFSPAGDWRDTIAKRLQVVAFGFGLALAQVRWHAVDSAVHAQRQAARLRAQHEAQHQAILAETARQTAERRARELDSIRDAAQQLRELVGSGATPAAVGEVIRRFSYDMRSALYDGLLSESPGTLGQLVIVTSTQLVLPSGDALSTSDLPEDLGSVRSISAGTQLIVGAQRGLWLLDEQLRATDRLTCPCDTVRSGFNAAARFGRRTIATHSELGVWQWDDGHATQLQPAERRRVHSARVLPDGRFAWAADRYIFTCSYDNVVTPLTDLPAECTTLVADGFALLAGLESGEVFRIDADTRQRERIWAGRGRAVRSVAAITLGGVPRVLVADGGLSVVAAVLHDTHTTEYRGPFAVRQTVGAAGVIAGVDELRERIAIWTTDAPVTPRRVIDVKQAAGKTVQDVVVHEWLGR